MAFMDDFARLPTQRKVLSFVIAGALLAGLYFQFVFKGLKADIEDAESEHDSKVAKNKQLADQLPQFEALKAQFTELQKDIAENKKALPTEAELPAFFETLNRKVNEAGVEVNSWKQLKEEPVETFMKVPVEIELTGTFMQIKRFFASLVPKKPKPGEVIAQGDQAPEQERIVSIDNLSLGNPTVKNREIILTARFRATTYREEEKKEPAPAPGAKPAAAPASAPAPTASPPMPSAATPAGAKARTENALDKADQKDRNAGGVNEAKTPGGGSNRLKGGL